MKLKLISFIIILFSSIACCTLAPVETGNFELKKADADKYAFVVTQVNRYRVESLPSEIYVWKK